MYTILYFYRINDIFVDSTLFNQTLYYFCKHYTIFATNTKKRHKSYNLKYTFLKNENECIILKLQSITSTCSNVNIQ